MRQRLWTGDCSDREFSNKFDGQGSADLCTVHNILTRTGHNEIDINKCIILCFEQLLPLQVLSFACYVEVGVNLVIKWTALHFQQLYI